MRVSRPAFSVRSAALPLVVALLLLTLIPAAAAGSAPALAIGKTPVLAYYYIWYTPDSWSRAKSDLPLLGAYASDDEAVMRQQVEWAKAAGIDGFFVSWKNTDALSGRLDQLVRIAREESFKLCIMYESLDFSRNPLPVDQVNADLGYFADTYADDPVFNLFGKPLVVWSGTWEYDRDQIASVTQPYRDRLQILASQKQVKTYDEIADLVDGNAYYWSSVNPDTYPDYPGKLRSMSDSVHAHGGLWIAPAAPGFDARHLGGQGEVDRRDGETLETQLSTAISSQPDAIGLISWNEFSENSHIEPSCDYGDTYLNLLARLIGGTPVDVTVPCDQDALAVALAGTDAGAPPSTPVAEATPDEVLASNFDWDSSAPEGTADSGTKVNTLLFLAPLAMLMGASFFLVVWRSLHASGPDRDDRIDHSLPLNTFEHPDDSSGHDEGRVS